MIRETLSPRPDWRAKVEALGLIWHAGETRPYWDESACYRFTRGQIDRIEAATTELYRLFLAAGEAVVGDPALLRRFAIPPAFHDPIREAWEAEPPSLNFGRFDLGFDGSDAPKLFEFNCDTPTSLLEAAVVQWAWKEECFPALDQFNSLHEAMVARWREIAPHLPATLHVAHVADMAGEDAVTAAYLRDTAEAAGITTVPILMERIGWDHDAHCFVDEADMRIEALFKLYPWEWLIHEEFAPASARQSRARRPDLAGADLEDDLVEQGDPAGAVGPVPRPSEPVARQLHRSERRCGCQAAAVAGGGERLDPPGRGHRGGNGGGLWRGGLYLPVALPPAGNRAGMLSGLGKLGGRRRTDGDGDPRGRADHFEHRAVRAACDRRLIRHD
ncbi:hypothetical protein QE379_001878 [Sphingomonas sp. SORGH_AS 879]|nr:hypothetical protein [Sphingomonas sp. SORGH_AS_0879]